MKFDFGLKVKFDSKCLINSKPSVYQMMNHEKFEKKSIPLDSGRLTFVSNSLNINYLEKLFKTPELKPTSELSKYVQYFTAYTISSFLILFLFIVIAYKFDSMTSVIFTIHIICGVFFITCSILLLYLVHCSPKLLMNNRVMYMILIYIKIIYYTVLDNKVICSLINEQTNCSELPLSLMVLIEFTMARVLLFYAYYEIALLASGTFLILIVARVFIVSSDLSVINEIFVMNLYILIFTAECYSRDFRMKQIFWRDLQEDQATNNYRLGHPVSPIGPEFNLISICDEVKKNLKYFSKVIIYKDVRNLAKSSLKEMMHIREVIEKQPLLINQIDFPSDLDEEDFAFITENFLEPFQQAVPTPNQLRTATLLFPGLSTIPDLQSALSNLGKNWNFDIFLIKDSSGQPISLVSDFLLKKWAILSELQIPDLVSKSFFSKLEKSYQENDFTNAYHAADVMHSLLCLILDSKIRETLASHELLSVIIAVLGHDAGHPGFSQRFLVLTRNPIACKYNDKSVLENLHCSIIFECMKESESNLFEKFSLAHWVRCRRLIIELVLGTDLNVHFEVLGKFRSRAVLMQDLNMEVDDDRTVALTLALKCADVGYSAKSMALHKKWMGLSQEEMFKQGDLEKEYGINVSTYCDRTKENTPKLAAGLLKNITIPMFEVYTQWLDTRICKETILCQAEKNLEYWEKIQKTSEKN